MTPRPFLVAFLEAKRYLADRGDLAFSIALPIALFALMYGVFSGDTQFSADAHIVDEDGGPAARELIDRVDAVEGLSVRLRDRADADAALDRSAIFTAIVIPAGFSSGLAGGEPVALTLRQRGSGGQEGQIVASIVTEQARRLAGEYEVRAVVRGLAAGSGVADARVDEVVARWAEEVRRAPPVVVERATVGGGAAVSDREALVERLMPGIVVMFLLFAVMVGSQSLVEERRIGTLERLMTTRLGVGQLFLGKYLAGLVRGVMQATVLLSLGFVALRVAGPGTYVQAIAFAAVVASAVSAIGLMLGSIAKTQDQAVWTGVFFTMFMTVFGGTFFDVGDEGFLAVMSRFTLNRYAIDAFEEILSGTGSVAGQRLELAVFAGVTVVALIAARLLFRVSSAGR